MMIYIKETENNQFRATVKVSKKGVELEVSFFVHQSCPISNLRVVERIVESDNMNWDDVYEMVSICDIEERW